MTWGEVQRAKEFLFLAKDLWYKMEQEGFVKGMQKEEFVLDESPFTQLERVGGWPQLGSPCR
jgi:hypothetical protein